MIQYAPSRACPATTSQRHAAWIFIWLAAVGALVAQNNEKKLSADELKELLDKKEVYFLDVREPKELEELGTIKGYVNSAVADREPPFGDPQEQVDCYGLKPRKPSRACRGFTEEERV